MQATQPYTKIRKMGVPREEGLCCVALRCVASTRSRPMLRPPLLPPTPWLGVPRGDGGCSLHETV